MINTTLIATIILGYLLGSLSSAIIICKIMRLPDPRLKGSGNPGASNVLRIGGKKAAALTLVGDTLKGTIPVLIAIWLKLPLGGIALTAFAAFMGHLYPIFFRFQGGKGVATLIGCLIALSWPTAIAFMLTWLVVAMLFRYASLSSLVATIGAPFFTWYFSNDIYTSMVCIMSGLLIIRHRSNILNLLRGKESKIVVKR